MDFQIHFKVRYGCSANAGRSGASGVFKESASPSTQENLDSSSNSH